ncbi:MAG: primosome assembly protein PriA, partial [bacterium]|nr:primosome assembly protein PriA [bacterium]
MPISSRQRRVADVEHPDQLALVPGPKARRTALPRTVDRAAAKPVAQVIIDSPLPHLDHVFDYAVPATAEGAVPGSRVRVRFAGRLTDAFVVGR